ncbi:MAG: alpha/beta fold hydrolase [Actinomycetota bacterium]
MSLGYRGGHDGALRAPTVVLVHGAGNNHTAWRYQTRYLAHHGLNVVAVDLPGHGANLEPRLTTIEEMAAWVDARLSELDLESVTAVGHSMGGLVALELAATSPVVDRLGLFGCGTRMPVNPRLQAVADACEPEAIAMIIGWSYDTAGRLGGHPDPGVWQTGINARLFERELSNLGPDLAACGAYRGGEVAASKIDVPCLLVGGASDRMVRPSAVEELGVLIQGSTVEVIDHAGHMMLTDSPEAVRKLLVQFLPHSL